MARQPSRRLQISLVLQGMESAIVTIPLANAALMMSGVYLPSGQRINDSRAKVLGEIDDNEDKHLSEDSMKQTILVFVSNVECIDMIKSTFQPYNEYDLIVVSNVENYGLVKLELGQVDVILMDMAFPTIETGMRFLKTIRADVLTKSVPLLVICHQEDQQSKIKAIEANATDIIPRPFSPQRLISSLEHVLNKPLRSSYVLSQHPSINFSPAEYVSREMQITKRMSSALSFVIIMPMDKTGEHDAVGKTESSLDHRLMEESCQLLRSTDVSFLNDNGDLFVVLPATGKRGALRTKEKVVKRFGDFLKAQNLNLDDLFHVFTVTYPEDGESMNDMMELVLKQKKQKEQLERQVSVLDRKLSKASLAYVKNKRYLI